MEENFVQSSSFLHIEDFFFAITPVQSTIQVTLRSMGSMVQPDPSTFLNQSSKTHQIYKKKLGISVLQLPLIKLSNTASKSFNFEKLM